MNRSANVLIAVLAFAACTSEPASSPTPATPVAATPPPASVPPPASDPSPAVTEGSATAPSVAPMFGQLAAAPARIVVRDRSNQPGSAKPREVTIDAPARVEAFRAALGPAATASDVLRRCADVSSFTFQDAAGTELARIGLCGAPSSGGLGGAELIWQGGRGKLVGLADEAVLAKLMTEALTEARAVP